VIALLGIATAAALTWSVSRLAGQHIGLSSAPLSVIQGLAPPRAIALDNRADSSPSDRAGDGHAAGVRGLATMRGSRMPPAPTAAASATSGTPSTSVPTTAPAIAAPAPAPPSAISAPLPATAAGSQVIAPTGGDGPSSSTVDDRHGDSGTTPGRGNNHRDD
jgi:hypothetical protein